MPAATSIQLPKPLLEAVDRRARALRVSRERVIVRALERELAAPEEWSSGFFEALAQVDEGRGLVEAVASPAASASPTRAKPAER
jgi:predicted transcriptional regulator